jgi:RNA polymerase sigma-70 factor (ECF subfamily)
MFEDRVLIWQYNRGKRSVLHRIYAKYKDDLMTLASALLYDRNSAEDVVHDVFTAFIRACGKLRLTENLKGYLITCVVNNVRNINKAGQRERCASLERAGEIAADTNGPDFAAIFGEQSQRLAWCLSQLPYEQREVLVLHLYSGLPFRTIAKLENRTINTIQGRYRYGLNKLRSLLKSEVEDETSR